MLSSFFRIRWWGVAGVCWLLCLLPVTCAWLSPLSAPDVHPGVYGSLYKPASPGPHPAVVVLHGANGLGPALYHFARTLAQQGYVALVLNYYAETGTVAREEVIRMLKQWGTWERTVQNSVQYLQASPDVQPDHIGIVGFSRGAFLALSAAGITPAVKAVVAYYGGALPSLVGYVQNLPPVLLLHGDADSRAPVAHSQAVYEALVRHGKPVEMFIYPGVEHSFNVPGAWYDPQADADAQKRTLMFLDKYLRFSKVGE